MKQIFIAGFALVAILTSAVLVQASPVEAADARTFNAGRIIDDGVFTNADSMSVSSIQSFLNSKVTCDTYGVKNSELGGGTRAQWLASRGIAVPVTCIRDYYENTSTGANNYGKAIPSGAISAAQIIYNYSRQFNINPQVLLVTLQKENGLITDEWPTPKQYSESMGFGCPDNVAPGAPACDPNYGSFSAQIYQAARHFRGYINNNPGWWVPFTTGANTVRFSPDANCGSSVINIENRSTVALYSYTPYQPNTAAKNAQYGQGDACSAHGNRNFFLYFTDWFGSTYGGDLVSTDLRLTGPLTINPTQPTPGQVSTVTYTVKNFSSQAITYDYAILQCRYNTTVNCDPPSKPSITLAAGESRTITYDITLPIGANYTLTPYFFKGGLWSRFGTQDAGINTLRINVPDMRLTSPMRITPANPQAGEKLTMNYTVRNYGTQPVVYQTSVMQCRYGASLSCDSNYGGAITVQPGQSFPVEYYITPPAAGNYTIVPYYMENDTWYKYNAVGDASPNSMTLDILDIRLVGNITSLPAQPIPGQTATITYTIKNFANQSVTYETSLLQCRIDQSGFCDTPSASPTTLAAGEQKTITETLQIKKSGDYALVPYFFKNGVWYKYNKGTATANTASFSVIKYVADMRLTSAIESSPATPIPGQSVTLNYSVKNFGTLPAIYQNSVLQCRINGTVNCDSTYSGEIIIAPGESLTFTNTFITPSSGTYTLRPYFMQNDTWYGYGPDPLYAWRNMVVPTYVADMRLTSPITINPANPSAGQTAIVSYTVKNFGNLPAFYQDSVLQCRRNTYVNCDSTYSGGLTIAAGASRTFTHSVQMTSAGNYTFVPYFLQNGNWNRYTTGTTPSNQLVMSI